MPRLRCAACAAPLRADAAGHGHYRMDSAKIDGIAACSRACSRVAIGAALVRPQAIGDYVGVAALERWFTMHRQPGVMTPEWLIEHYELAFIASGTYGVVFSAALRDAQGLRLPMAIKLEFVPGAAATSSAASEYTREATVQMALTAAYAGIDDQLSAPMPVVKLYDWAIAGWTNADRERFRAYQELIAQAPGRRDIDVGAVAAAVAATGADAVLPWPVVGYFMEQVRARTMTDMLADELAPPDVYHQRLVDVFAQVALTLHGLQAVLGFVHYDLHPSNVMVDDTGATGAAYFRFPVDTTTAWFFVPTVTAKLVDFGFARVEFVKRTLNGAFVLADNGRLLHDASGRAPSVVSARTEYEHRNGDSGQFKPWADLYHLAMRTIASMPAARLAALPTALWRVLLDCINVPGEYSNEHIMTVAFVQPLAQGSAAGSSIGPMQQWAARAALVVPSSVAMAGAYTPRRMLRANAGPDGAFHRHATTQPSNANYRIVDMSPEFGGRSVATQVTTAPDIDPVENALQKSRRRRMQQAARLAAADEL